MNDIKVTAARELVVENTDLVLIDKLDWLVQRLSIKLQFIFGEWFIDHTDGIKFHEHIWVKNPNYSLVESSIKTAILEEEGVTELLKFQMVVDPRLRKLS